jgi:hypothetical protein
MLVESTAFRPQLEQYAKCIAVFANCRFCELLPDNLLWAEDPVSHRRIRVEPGSLRHFDVKVGHQVAVSPGSLPRFLDRLSEA